MRFKAKISQENNVVLIGITTLLEKVGKTAVIYLSEEYLRLAVITDNPDSPKIYSELKAALFLEYRIESQSDNTILFEIGLHHLSSALASGKNSPFCHLKLVKRGVKPFLCFETRALQAMVVDVTHDIPIRIINPSDILFYVPPDVALPMVSLELPRGKIFRTIVERMAKISKHIHIDAAMTGNVILWTDTGSVTVKTYFNGLTPYPAAMSTIATPGIDITERIMHNKASVKIDVRKLLPVLHFQSLLSWDHAFIFMTANETLVLHISLSAQDTGSVTCYVPVMIETDLMEEGEEEGDIGIMEGEVLDDE